MSDHEPELFDFEREDGQILRVNRDNIVAALELGWSPVSELPLDINVEEAMDKGKSVEVAVSQSESEAEETLPNGSVSTTKTKTKTKTRTRKKEK